MCDNVLDLSFGLIDKSEVLLISPDGVVVEEALLCASALVLEELASIFMRRLIA